MRFVLHLQFVILAGLLSGHLTIHAHAQTKIDAVSTAQLNASIDNNTRSGGDIAKDVPVPSQVTTGEFVRMQAASTPSGFIVPRYVSLKYGSSNGRTGPSRGHPVAWRYKRRGLPMIVIAETEMWRKVRDVNGDESWMSKRLLSGKHMVIARTDIMLRAKPKSDSKSRALATQGALLALQDCGAQNWCLVRDSASNISGYALKSLLWGAQSL